jgi:hypothetical protein
VCYAARRSTASFGLAMEPDRVERPQIRSPGLMMGQGWAPALTKLFKEMISGPGQPSQLAAPKYDGSTKRHAPRRHILAVERREKNFVTLTLTVRESCLVGIYVYVNMSVHVPALPKPTPHGQLPACTTTVQSMKRQYVSATHTPRHGHPPSSFNDTRS